jgi:hypothetical protein
MRAVGLVAVVIAIGTACAPPPRAVPSASGDVCATTGLDYARSYGPSVHLVAAFTTTVADVASWHASPGGPGSVPSGRPLDRVDVCYYDGADVAKGPPPPASAAPYDRIRIIVASDGSAGLDAAGASGTFPLASPPHGP